jgi:hypothetical protein
MGEPWRVMTQEYKAPMTCVELGDQVPVWSLASIACRTVEGRLKAEAHCHRPERLAPRLTRFHREYSGAFGSSVSG